MIDSKFSVSVLPLLAALSLGLFVLDSCGGDDDYLKPDVVDGGASVSLSEKALIPTGDSFTMAFTANTPWTLEGRPDWLDVSKTSGRRGTTSIVVSASMNASGRDRNCTLVFKANDGSFSRELAVSQPYPYLIITNNGSAVASGDTLKFVWDNVRDAHAGAAIDTTSRLLAIQSNVNWRIFESSTLTKAPGIDLTHFSISSQEGFGDFDFHVIPTSVNFGKAPYDMPLHIKAVYPDENGDMIDIPTDVVKDFDINLHQNNLRFLINQSTNDTTIVIDELNSDKNIDLTMDSEVEWSLDRSSAPSWVRLSQDSGSGVVTLNVQADGANPAKTLRSGIVTLRTSVGAYRNIYVSQDPYKFSISGNSLSIGNDDVAEKEFTLRTTGSWVVRDIPSWLSVTPSECATTAIETGDSVFVIRMAAKGQNLDFNDLNQVVSVESTMNSLSESVSVEQDKFVFDVSASSTLADIPTMNTVKYPVRIESSGKWEIDGKPDWIDVSQLSSDVKGTFDLTVGANAGNPDLDNDRSATLTLVSVNHREAGQNVTRTINVKQRKYIFEITPSDNVTIPAYKNNFDTFSTTVRCSAEWELTECPSWVTPSSTSGDGINDVTITFTPSVNSVKVLRSGTVRVRSLYNNEEKSFAVSQDAFVFDNTDATFDVVVMNTQAFPVSFDLTAEAGWTVAAPSWLRPSAASGSGAGTISFTPDPNPNLTERTGSAVIHSSVNGEDKTITFTQERYVFDSSDESFSYTELDKSTNTISITSSGPWTISDAPSWMNISSLSGQTSSSISISPSNNTALAGRSSTFHIVSTLNNLQKPVSVEQAAYKFDQEHLSYSYTTLEERSDAFDVLSSGSWTARDVPSWMTLSKSSGTGSEESVKESVTATSSRNLTESDRSGVIRIVSDDNPSLAKEISVSQDKFDFRIDHTSFAYTDPLDASTRTLQIVCPSEWTISSNQPWVSISSGTGSGNASLIIAPQQNLTVSDRSATLTVTSTLNSLTRTLTLSQPRFIFDVTGTGADFSSPIGEDNTPASVNISCSAGWTVASDAEWLHVFTSERTGNATVTVTPDNNLSTAARTGSVTVTSTMNSLTETITFSQAAFVFNVASTASAFTSPIGSQNTPAAISVECSSTWTASADVDWLRLSTSDGTGNGTVSVTPLTNSSAEERTGTVTITSTLNGLSKEFTFIQPRYEFDASAANLTMDANSRLDQSVNVICSGEWSVSNNSSSWLSVEQSATSGNGTVRLTARPNPDSTSRSAVVTITSTDNPSFVKRINVIQDGFVFAISSTSSVIPASSTSPITATVTCSSSWTAACDAVWLTVSRDGSTLTMIPDVNEGEARTAVVTISNSLNSKVLMFTVTQEGI